MIYVIFIQHDSEAERCVDKTSFGNGKRPIRCNPLAITPLLAAEPLIARSIEALQEHQSKVERSCSDLVNKLIPRQDSTEESP